MKQIDTITQITKDDRTLPKPLGTLFDQSYPSAQYYAVRQCGEQTHIAAEYGIGSDYTVTPRRENLCKGYPENKSDQQQD